jgi:WD40 repeat protein
MIKRILTALLAGIFMLSSQTWAKGEGAMVPTARIDESSLSSVINSPIIQSFDLSPDGKTVAMLAVAGTKVAAPLWLVVEDIESRHIVASREIGPSTFPSGGLSAQVLFASDQQFLVVQDLQTVRVFDAKSLAPLRTIPPSSNSTQPLYIIGAKNKDIFVCAYGAEQKFNPRLHRTPAQIKIVDVASGSNLGEWSSEDVPQSVSPDGRLIAVSSWQSPRSVLPLAIFDTKGRMVAEMTGGFSFKKPTDESTPVGRVIGLFVDSEELILSPDLNIDQTGHHSGETLQNVLVTGQIKQTIKPQHYGPTGEMAVSGDKKTVAVISWFIPTRALAHEHGVLPSSSPELLIFDRGVNIQKESTTAIHGLSLKSTGWMENLRPRLSFDGTVIAIAQDNGITVFAKKAGKN